ncbi:NAD(P)-dependent oxidoreductase [Blastomonas sp. AAP53]|uniref:NAD-dependent epimerase/dehydratase family protein n=1 Tax=Blastomonas sp. AAP53 TaxID=1248760 RepID=UPI000310EFA5|nr:NAD(P)-dependent oxidoreductase [Blastomonas sp. AAP53]
MTLALLTGATGFVGRQLLARLGERGIAVRAVVREGTQDRLSACDTLQNVISTPSLFHESAQWWEEVSQGVDLVIHAAWYAQPGQYLVAPENMECLTGTITMAQGCLQSGVKRFVGLGTCFEYDVSHGLLGIDTPLRPTSPYGDAKAATYLALSHWLPQAGMEFLWCRLFYLHGEGEDERRFVPYLRAKLQAGETADLTSGQQVRDYLDVRDAAAMIVDRALGRAQGAVNICSGIPITIRAMAESIADENGRRDLLNFGARPDNLVDPPHVVGQP